MSASAVAETGPYGATAWRYRQAGWNGVLPLPPREKAPVPSGFTGRGAPDPGPAQIDEWVQTRRFGNIALRLPDGVVGLDVDAYGEKTGARSLSDREAEWGPLPATWKVTSREDPISGIRLYRTPLGLDWAAKEGILGSGIELLHSGHRYAVVFPSIHPDTGRMYLWVDPNGITCTFAFPPVESLPLLPERWVHEITAGAPARPATERAEIADLPGQIAEWDRPPVPMLGHCARMQERLHEALHSLDRPDLDGSRHDATRAHLLALIGFAAKGHTGLGIVLTEIWEKWEDTVGRDRPGRVSRSEFARLVEGAVQIVVADPSTPEHCDGAACGGLAPEGVVPALSAPLPGAGPVGGVVAPHPLDGLPTGLLARLTADPALTKAVLDLDRNARARETYREILAVRNPQEPPDLGTLAEMLNRPEETAFRIDGVLPASGRLLISAQRKVGKTTLVGNLARALLLGEPFLGSFETRKISGRVVVLNYEVSGGQFARWMKDLEIPLDQMFVINLRGRRNLLADEQGQEELVSIIRNAEGEALIVDPFGRAFTGANQNDAADVTPWLVRLDKVATDAGTSELVLVAHTGWDGERTRGSTALEDWPDSIVRLVKDDDGVRFFSATGRDVEVDEDALTFESATRRLFLAGSGSRKKTQKTSAMGILFEPILEILSKNPGLSGSGVTKALKEQGVSFNKGHELIALRNLTERGRIYKWLPRENRALGPNEAAPNGVKVEHHVTGSGPLALGSGFPEATSLTSLDLPAQGGQGGTSEQPPWTSLDLPAREAQTNLPAPPFRGQGGEVGGRDGTFLQGGREQGGWLGEPSADPVAEPPKKKRPRYVACLRCSEPLDPVLSEIGYHVGCEPEDD